MTSLDPIVGTRADRVLQSPCVVRTGCVDADCPSFFYLPPPPVHADCLSPLLSAPPPPPVGRVLLHPHRRRPAISHVTARSRRVRLFRFRGAGLVSHVTALRMPSGVVAGKAPPCPACPAHQGRTWGPQYARMHTG